MSEEKMAISGNLVDLKYMKVSGKLRAVVEIEPEMVNAAWERLGGYPNPAENRLIALAVMSLPKPKEDADVAHNIQS